MEQHNPYKTPSSNTELNTSGQAYQSKIFSLTSRIGRLRYQAYSWVCLLLLMLAGILVRGIIGLMEVTALNPSPDNMLWYLALATYIPSTIYSFILAKRRLNDLNQSGWFLIFLFAPFLNLLFILYLIFFKGSPKSNQYGPAPTKNSLMVIIPGILFPATMITIAIMIAIAGPAFQEYSRRVEQAAHELQNQ